MAKSQKTNKDTDQVLFITSAKLTKPGVQLHSGKETVISKSIKEVGKDWDNMMDHLSSIVSNTKSKLTETGYDLDEITIGLGFNASGKLAFIAEAGIEASIEVKFKKKDK